MQSPLSSAAAGAAGPGPTQPASLQHGEPLRSGSLHQGASLQPSESVHPRGISVQPPSSRDIRLVSPETLGIDKTTHPILKMAETETCELAISSRLMAKRIATQLFAGIQILDDDDTHSILLPFTNCVSRCENGYSMSTIVDLVSLLREKAAEAEHALPRIVIKLNRKKRFPFMHT